MWQLLQTPGKHRDAGPAWKGDTGRLKFCLMTEEMWELRGHWPWEEMDHGDTGQAMAQLE